MASNLDSDTDFAHDAEQVTSLLSASGSLFVKRNNIYLLIGHCEATLNVCHIKAK